MIRIKGYNFCYLKERKVHELEEVFLKLIEMNGYREFLRNKKNLREYADIKAAYSIITDILFGRKYPLKRIGYELGGLNHSTILYHRKTKIHYPEVKILVKDFFMKHYNYDRPHLSDKVYDIIMTNESLRFRLLRLLPNHNDNSVISMAQVKHKIFSQDEFMDIILDFLNTNRKFKLQKTDLLHV